jgi:hypothetical protein
MNVAFDDLRYAQETRAAYRALIPAAGAPDPVAMVRDIVIPAGSPVREIPARVYVPRSVTAMQIGLPWQVTVRVAMWPQPWPLRHATGAGPGSRRNSSSTQ